MAYKFKTKAECYWPEIDVIATFEVAHAETGEVIHRQELTLSWRVAKEFGVVDLDFCRTFESVLDDCGLIENLHRACITGKLRSAGTWLSITFCLRKDTDKRGLVFLESGVQRLFELLGWTAIDKRVRCYKDFHGPQMVTGLYHLRKVYAQNGKKKRGLYAKEAKKSSKNNDLWAIESECETSRAAGDAETVS